LRTKADFVKLQLTVSSILELCGIKYFLIFALQQGFKNLEYGCMETKVAMFTVDVGGDSDYFPAMLSAQYYADKYGIDYFVAKEPAIRFLYPPFEKHQGFRLFDMGYDRILILDRDVLVTPDAPNIFECFPDTNTLYAFDGSAPDEIMNADAIINGIRSGIDWPKNAKGTYTYFNSGVVIISRNFNGFMDGFRDLPEIPPMRTFPEQTSMNYMVFKKGIKFEDLGYKWNRMNCGLADPENKRYESYFIHYAGKVGFAPGISIGENIRRDFIHFYGEEPLRAGADGLRYQTLPGESGEATEKSIKKCSIFFLCDPEFEAVNSYLRHIFADKLPADYELLFNQERLQYIDPGYSEVVKGSVKIVAIIEQLGFDQTCIDIARQAQGRYVVFLMQPTGRDEILEAARQLEVSGDNIAVGKGKYIVVNRETFIKSGGFKDMLSESERLAEL